MFEIGNSLQEARLRQSLDLARVEDDTKIRAKYLHALEDERFELLPAETYVKGFLRTYAEYLGLDGQLYVDEFNSRFASVEEPPVASRAPHRARARAVESNFVVVALAGIVAVTVLVVVAWQFGSGDAPTGDAVGLVTAAPATTAAPPQAAPPPPHPRAGTAETRPQARTARLLLTASRGDCWLAVRAGSATGELLFEGTLERGEAMRFARKRLWIQLGAAGNVDAKLNGKPIRGFPDRESIVVVTARGARTLSTV